MGWLSWDGCEVMAVRRWQWGGGDGGDEWPSGKWWWSRDHEDVVVMNWVTASCAQSVLSP